MFDLRYMSVNDICFGLKGNLAGERHSTKELMSLNESTMLCIR